MPRGPRRLSALTDKSREQASLRTKSDNPLFDLLDLTGRGSKSHLARRSRSPPPRERDLMSELRRRDPQSGDLLRSGKSGYKDGKRSLGRRGPDKDDAYMKDGHHTLGRASGDRTTSIRPKASSDRGETKVSKSVLSGANRPVYSAKPNATKVLSIRGVSSTSVQIKCLAPGTTQRDILSVILSELNVQVEQKDCHVFAVRGGQSCVAEINFADRETALRAIDVFDGATADGVSQLEASLLLDPPEYEAVRNMSTVSGTQHIGGGQKGQW